MTELRHQVRRSVLSQIQIKLSERKRGEIIEAEYSEEQSENEKAD